VKYTQPQQTISSYCTAISQRLSAHSFPPGQLGHLNPSFVPVQRQQITNEQTEMGGLIGQHMDTHHLVVYQSMETPVQISTMPLSTVRVHLYESMLHVQCIFLCISVIQNIDMNITN
jgi:hypothetical protein